MGWDAPTHCKRPNLKHLLLMQDLDALADCIQRLTVTPPKQPGSLRHNNHSPSVQALCDQAQASTPSHLQLLDADPGSASRNTSGQKLGAQPSQSARLISMYAASDDEGSDAGQAKGWDASSLTSNDSDAFLDGLLSRAAACGSLDDDSPRSAPPSLTAPSTVIHSWS